MLIYIVILLGLIVFLMLFDTKERPFAFVSALLGLGLFFLIRHFFF